MRNLGIAIVRRKALVFNLEGSSSAVSKPLFASKYSLCNNFRDLKDKRAVLHRSKIKKIAAGDYLFDTCLQYLSIRLILCKVHNLWLMFANMLTEFDKFNDVDC